jgi:hypothetical protein
VDAALSLELFTERRRQIGSNRRPHQMISGRPEASDGSSVFRWMRASRPNGWLGWWPLQRMSLARS